MNIENYTLNCTALQNEWKERHQKRNLTKFIYDGIVNEDFWKKSEKKVTFFLKEAYLKEDVSEGNLCRSLNKWTVWKMWRAVSDWIYALQNVTTEAIPAYHSFDCNNNEASTERVRSISVVNIKKSEGKATSNYDDLMSFVKQDSDLIQKQIDEINPDIIVCGNTGYYFEVVYGAELDEKERIISNAKYNGFEINHSDFTEKGYIWAGDTLIINYCHPANHFHRQGKYYAFAALYQQALIEHNKA